MVNRIQALATFGAIILAIFFWAWIGRDFLYNLLQGFDSFGLLVLYLFQYSIPIAFFAKEVIE